MGYFRIDSREQYDMYEGDKMENDGHFLIHTSAFKTPRTRIAYAKAQLLKDDVPQAEKDKYLSYYIPYWESKL